MQITILAFSASVGVAVASVIFTILMARFGPRYLIYANEKKTA